MTPQQTSSIARARADLARASKELDDAERALPDSEGDTTMASPALMAVLERVRAAQRYLSDLETLLLPAVAAILPAVAAVAKTPAP